MSFRRWLPTLGCALVLAAAPLSLAHAEEAPKGARPQLVPPKLVENVEPTYPPERAGKERETIVVTLDLSIDAEGKVSSAKVVGSGGDLFDQAALDAGKRLVFAPATRDGKAIPSTISFRFSFVPVAPVVAKPREKPAADEKPAPGALRGAIVTAKDEPLAGATVTLRLGDGLVATAITDERGAFAFEGLAPSRYRVTVTLDGFDAFAVDEEVQSKSATAVVYRPTAKAVAGGGAGDVIELEVKGEKPPREVTRHAISGDEIRHIPGTNGDAIRSVENLPGVARPPSVVGALIVRGSGPFDTSVFVDGTWITAAYHFGGLTSVIPSELLERIDFYPGNFGVQYGNAMGGIVDIGLRSPRKDGYHGLLQFDLLDGRVMAEGPLGKRTRFLVAARRSWIDAWLAPVLESAGAGVSTAPVYYDGQAILEHDLTEKTTLRLSFFGAADKLAITLNAPDPNDPIAGDFGISQSFWRVQGRADSRLTGGLSFRNMISFGGDTQDIEFAGNYMRITQRPLEIRSDLRGKIAPGVDGIVGLDLQQWWVDVALRVPPIPREGEAPSPYFARPSSTFDFSATSFRPGAYAMLDLQPRPGLRLMPGVRVDHTQETTWNVSPRIALRWDAHHEYPRTTLKGGVGVFYQPPQGFQSIAPYGTPGLANNRATHFSAGFEQELAQGVELSVEGFYKDLRNLVVQTDAAGRTASGAAFSNAGSGRVFGGEFLLRAKRDRFFGWIAYTLSRSERRDVPGDPLRVFQYDQTHILTALASYQLGRGWQIGARWRYVTGNPYTPYAGGIADYDAGSYAAIPAPLYSARDPAFHRLDVRVDKTWKFQDWSLSAYLDVQNAYNRRNAEGRQYNFDYSQSQPVAGLPILPIIGLRGEL
jgi:TonB family protein